MSRIFTTYPEAAAYARFEARRRGRCMGIEAWREYGVGPVKFRVFGLPDDPAKRFGFEARCEVVNPSDPLSSCDLEILAAMGLTVKESTP